MKFLEMKYMILSKHRGFPEDKPVIVGVYPWYWLAWIMLIFWHTHIYHITWIERGKKINEKQ